MAAQHRCPILIFLNDTPPTGTYTLSLHDALPILLSREQVMDGVPEMVDSVQVEATIPDGTRSEEHTSELQSRPHLVCRLLLEKKKSRAPVLALGQGRLAEAL